MVDGCMQVAWVRVDTQTILTIHNNVISRNPRLSLSRPAEKKWDLHIDRYLDQRSFLEDLGGTFLKNKFILP
jgi:hypothetical protein